MTRRLTWTRTWPDRSYDFSAADGEIPVGRVYRLTGGPAGGHWHWTMTALVGNRQGTASGVADDRDTACRFVEDGYRAFRKSIREG